MSRTSETKPTIKCSNQSCGKTLAKEDGIKCRCCNTVTPIHFYPGNAIGGRGIEADWEYHWKTARLIGCDICGIEPDPLTDPDAIPIHFDPVSARSGHGIAWDWKEHWEKAKTEGCEICRINPQSPNGSHAAAANYKKVPVPLDTKGTDYRLPEFAVLLSDWLAGARVLVISADGPEFPELDVPIKYLRSLGADVKLAGQDWIFQYRNPAGHIVIAEWLSDEICIKADLRLSDVRLDEFDALFIPGGAWNPDMLRTDDVALKLVRDAHAKGLLIVSLCHGPQVLISAAFDAPQGQQNFPSQGTKITGTTSIRRDLKNAGFVVYADEPVVYDDKAQLLTARDPNDLGPLCEEFGRLLKTRIGARPIS